MKTVINFLKGNMLTVIIIIVGVLFARKLMRVFAPGGVLSGESPEMLAHREKMNENITTLKVEQEKMSKTMLQIMTAADTLYNAMIDPGTNEKLVFETLTGMNTEDLKALYKAFGIRTDYAFYVIPLQTGNLFDWFQAELSDSDFNKVKLLFSKTGLI